MGDKSTHKKKKSGKKASKKKAAAAKKGKAAGGLAPTNGGAPAAAVVAQLPSPAQLRQRNPKAFINASSGRAKLQRARTADKDQKRMHGARLLWLLLA